MGRRTEQHWWSPSAKRDMALLVAVLLLATGLAHRYDAFEWFAGWAANHENWQVDELAAISMVLVVALAIFATRRWQEAVTEAETHRATTERLQTSEKQFRQGFDAAGTG